MVSNRGHLILTSNATFNWEELEEENWRDEKGFEVGAHNGQMCWDSMDSKRRSEDVTEVRL